MEVIGIVIFLIAAIALIIAIGVDLIEYRRYRRASTAVIALGAAMEQQFKMVVGHLERLGMENVELSQKTNLLQQQQIFINSVMQIHSEALGLKEMKDVYKLHEEFTQGVE